MNLCLVGLNHRTAPVAVREKAAVRNAKLSEALEALRAYCPHGVVLSTCNRTEIYTVPEDVPSPEAASLDFLRTHLDVPEYSLGEHIYTACGTEAVAHLLRTTCGLDSMVLGEYEVLGQVRQALEAAEKAKMVNLPLRHVFQSAVRTGRNVREETGISKNAFSVSSVAVDLAAKATGELTGSRMLVVGAGEAGKLVAKAARDRGVSDIVVASRTQERAASLTQMLGGSPVNLSNLRAELASCNIVVTCADAPHCLLDIEQVSAAMSARPSVPMVIIDIAVPRNVAPAVTEINNVFLYNIDDLSRIAERNRRRREAETGKAEEIIAGEVSKIGEWWQNFKVRPVIRALMDQAEDIRRSHLERTVKKLPPLNEEERYSLEMMTRAIVAKILKAPIQRLKADGNGPGGADYTRLVEELFQLREESAG